ncbi:hypothetical protein Tco_0583118 [Tanacetum coccineum]
MRWSSYARAMIELRADEELKDTIIVAMPKLVSEGFNMCTIRVEYEWKPPRCSSCKFFEHVLNECPKKIVSDVVKNLNNPKQATRDVLVGFKSTKKIYRPIPNKNGASASGKKKQVEVFRQEVIGWEGVLSVTHGSSSNTPIIEKIYKLERHILDGKLMPVDDDGKPLVPTGNMDSDSEMEVVFDETANLLASTTFKGGSDRGYGTNNLLEQ